MSNDLARREFLKRTGVAGAGALLSGCAESANPRFEISLFEADVTPDPDQHPLLAGNVSRSIADPLFVHGFVITGAGAPLVLAAVDWCEIRNDSYERWRSLLAAAAGTTKERVLVTCLHQHDAPYTDRVAQSLMEQHSVPGAVCDVEFEDRIIERVASALTEGMAASRPITHLGLGQAKAEELASSRRYVLEDGTVSWGRGSTTRDPQVRAQPEGLIDSWVKTISFWEEDEPVAALSCYAIHPMSYYGDGDISADFVGMARSMRQKDTPATKQIYVSGCSGDLTAGKYNDGNRENRPIFAERLHKAMADAWEATQKFALGAIEFRASQMRMPPRESPGYAPDDYQRTIADDSKPFRDRWAAALGLSWLERYNAGHAIDVPVIEFGGDFAGGFGPDYRSAQLALLPAESFVQYQLWAQQMRPDSLVMVMGYGECAPGYIPTAKDAAEGYDDHYSWIAFPECEQTIRTALQEALTTNDT